MATKFHIVAIVSDTAPNALKFYSEPGIVSRQLGRKITLPARTASEAALFANKLYFLLTGERDATPFNAKALRPNVPRVAVSSACRDYHVEVWRAGVAFDAVPGASDERHRFEKGNAADWRTDAERVADALASDKRPAGHYSGKRYHLAAPERGYWAEWTGEFRPPRAGELYLSGAVVLAYPALNDLSTSYFIARKNHGGALTGKCQVCGHYGDDCTGEK